MKRGKNVGDTGDDDDDVENAKLSPRQKRKPTPSEKVLQNVCLMYIFVLAHITDSTVIMFCFIYRLWNQNLRNSVMV